MGKVLGQIIAGSFDRILVRQKADANLELGDLVIVRNPNAKIICQVYDLIYGSQLSQQHLELMSGMRLEQGSQLELFDASLRAYNIACLKPLVSVKADKVALSKELPPFFSEVEEVQLDDMSFLTKPKNALRLGFLRSGSKRLPIEIFVDASLALSHHMMIPAQTGKGKSNLTKSLLWNNLENPVAGFLVIDPHDEYYGRTGLGLKDHYNKNSVSYYTVRNPPQGAKTLRINVSQLHPRHLQGVFSWTDAQSEALALAYKKLGDNWVEALLSAQSFEYFQEGTLSVIKRRLMWLLDIEDRNGRLTFNGAFDTQTGLATISSIIDDLEDKRVVIVDTSTFNSATETLIGVLIATEILNRYQSHNAAGVLEQKPVISIVLEEAARVLGKESLESGANIFATLAREGRKFKVGLIAITQLPSSIPRDILANMSTKIILGLEMSQERQAVIESAAQDLSKDDRTIASLDKGEALVTSTFTRFAIPIHVPLFKDLVKEQPKARKLTITELSS
ncbi:MAG: DUF87 domain-containing protein [Nanoarchaeota archaeon]